jgi:hypothetical protein
LKAKPFQLCEFINDCIAIVSPHTTAFHSSKWNVWLIIYTLVINVNHASLIKSDVIPVLNILEILTILEEYTIAMDGVVEGMALEIEQARPAAITGGIGFTPAPIAKAAAATFRVTTADIINFVPGTTITTEMQILWLTGKQMRIILLQGQDVWILQLFSWQHCLKSLILTSL